MYAFKVFTSTLIMIMIALMFYTAFKSDNTGKLGACVMGIVYALSIIAIWG